MYYGTPPIVTNGLVLNLDAASQKAQPTRNLYNGTTALTNTAYWQVLNSTVTASATTAPDGTNTAVAWNINTAGTGSLVRFYTANTNVLSASIAGGQYTFSVYAKNRNCTAADFQIGIYNGTQTLGLEPSYAINSGFAPTGASAYNNFTDVVRRSEDVGNGWYRVSLTATVSSSMNTFSNFLDIEAGTGTRVAGEGIYIWGPQLEVGPVPTPYQPVTLSNKTWPGLTFDNYSGSYSNVKSRPTYVADNGGSLVFDGFASQMTLGTGSSYPFPFHTYEIWAKSPGTGSAMVDGAGLVAFDYGRLVSYNSAGQLRYVQTSGSAAVLFSRTTTETFFDNKWHHIVCSRGASQAEMYVDGVLINSGSSGTSPGWDGLNSWSTMQVLLGDNPNNITYKLKGSIASVRVYNRQLSQQEVTQNYNALKSRFI